jgi:hypothetical protein
LIAFHFDDINIFQDAPVWRRTDSLLVLCSQWSLESPKNDISEQSGGRDCSNWTFSNLKILQLLNIGRIELSGNRGVRVLSLTCQHLQCRRNSFG